MGADDDDYYVVVQKRVNIRRNVKKLQTKMYCNKKKIARAKRHARDEREKARERVREKHTRYASGR